LCRNKESQQIVMWKIRLAAVLILIGGALLGFFALHEDFASRFGIKVPAFVEKFSYKLGLDLSGGTHLVYRADVSKIEKSQVPSAMASLRDVIERRINIFGVSEPVIQTQNGSFTNQGEERLTVDLPGVTDVKQAVALIGQTPLLEFKVERPEGAEKDALEKKLNDAQTIVVNGGTVDINLDDPYYVSSELTGRYLEKAVLEFDQATNSPVIALQFNNEGSALFEKLTKENVGKTIAIYLDGAPLSTPVVREAITGGRAQISGTFTPQEAKTLVGRLNSGALPVPIELVSTTTIGPSLGTQAVKAGVMAGLIGLLAIIGFLILWYRLPGIIASVSLIVYAVIVLSIFKLFGVVLSAAGIAGFIISIGTAVDANILIFERMKEEVRSGRGIADSMRAGFDRAWSSIYDSNFTTLGTAVILFSLGVSVIKGFALTLIIGILASLFSAYVVTRIFLYAFGSPKTNKITGFLFGSGLSSARGK
jgi:preprotein translocase subunit SecD